MALPGTVRSTKGRKWVMKEWSMTIASLVLLLTLGCGVLPTGVDTEDTAPTVSHTGGSGLGFTWPESIPDDIPVLEGDISIVMEAPGSHIRIFYQNLSERQLEQYLNQLEKEEFELEYVIYTREGYPDKSEERLKRGEYDAVDITRGEYRMRLEYGKDTTVYDTGLSVVFP
jgi:hypothetical protein